MCTKYFKIASLLKEQPPAAAEDGVDTRVPLV